MAIYFSQTGMMYKDTAPQDPNDMELAYPSTEMVSYLTSIPVTRDFCWTEVFELRTASTGTGGPWA